MEKKKYLPLYEKWIKTGKIKDCYKSRGRGGLCNTGISRDALSIFKPEGNDFKVINHVSCYWASDLPQDDKYDDKRYYEFNQFRQNVVLLLAAMNGEL